MISTTQVTPRCNNVEIESPYFRPIENPYNRSREFTQKQNYPANSYNTISIHVTLEHLLAVTVFLIGIFSKGGILNTKDFINKYNLDIGKILNILGMLKTEKSNSDRRPIINTLNKTRNKGGQPIMSDRDINPSNFADIIKQAIEIANELKKDPNVVDAIKNSKGKVDTDTIENITNKLKDLDEQKNIDPGNIESIVEQAIEIVNEIKKTNN